MLHRIVLGAVALAIFATSAVAQFRSSDAEFERGMADFERRSQERKAHAARLARGPLPPEFGDPRNSVDMQLYLRSRIAFLDRVNPHPESKRQAMADLQVSFGQAVAQWASQQPASHEGLKQLKEAASTFDDMRYFALLAPFDQEAQRALRARAAAIEPALEMERQAQLRRGVDLRRLDYTFWDFKEAERYYDRFERNERAVASQEALAAIRASARSGPTDAMMSNLLARTYLSVRPFIQGLGIADSLLVADNEVGLDLGVAAQSFIWDARDVRCTRASAAAPFRCSYLMRATVKMSVLGMKNQAATDWTRRTDTVVWGNDRWLSPTVEQLMRQIAAEQARNAPPSSSGGYDAAKSWCNSMNRGFAAVGKWSSVDWSC